jgi:hypothetical protein
MQRGRRAVVAVLLHASGTEVAHVGDSRCYLVHEGQIFQLTKDHSMVQQLVDAGLLTPAQAAVHPNANQITRALGMSPEVEVESKPQPVSHVVGDAFVLCSDGLSDLVEPNEILQIVGSAPAAQAAGQLIDLANARGGHDNISVVILRARESATAPATRVLPTLAETMADTISDEEDGPSQRITLPGEGSPAEPRRERTTQPSPSLHAQRTDPPSAPPAPRAEKKLSLVKVIGGILAVIVVFLLFAFVYARILEARGPRGARDGRANHDGRDGSDTRMPTDLSSPDSGASQAGADSGL